MPLRKIIAHTFIACYVSVTLSAALFSFTKVNVTPIPWPVLRYSYGMMAPFQGYSTTNVDLLAEGLNDKDEWKTIDLDPYYPMILGTQIMYRRMRSFSFIGEDMHKQKYTELAELLLEREKHRGRTYEAIRLTWQEWPASPKAWDALRKESEITNHFITQIP